MTQPQMATPSALFKYTSAATAEDIIRSGRLRWSSPELFDEPWAVKLDPKLGFDHIVLSKMMLKMATSMIFTRDLPSGDPEHPLYKAIRRWRAEERFNDENEAYDALAELLAPSPESLEAKINGIVDAWQEMISNARVLCLSESNKELTCWEKYADQHRGVAFRFDMDPETHFHDPKPMDYNLQRPHLTTLREQVNDLVGIKRANVINELETKLLTKPKKDDPEKEWRIIRVMEEEDLDCGEDVIDWYMDEPFPKHLLSAIYIGFAMPEEDRADLIDLLKATNPSVAVYQCRPIEEQYDLEFDKI